MERVGLIVEGLEGLFNGGVGGANKDVIRSVRSILRKKTGYK